MTPLRLTLTIGVVEVVSRAQLRVSLDDLRTHVSDPREGILGPRSVAWALGGDLGVFLGGGRAALMQLAYPGVAQAIADHSATRADLAGRFQRTFANVFAMVFGTLDEACRAARIVHAVHSRIHGTIPHAIGGWAAGSSYDANALEALIWVHSTLVDTTLAIRELFDGPVPRERADRYLVEMHRFAALFGIPATRLPHTRAAHAQYMTAMLASDRIVVSPVAKAMARFLVGRDRIPPMAAPQPLLGRIGEAVTHALLPTRLAAEFGLDAAPARVRLGLPAFAALYRRLPARLVELPARAAARARLANTPPGRWPQFLDRQLASLARRTAGA